MGFVRLQMSICNDAVRFSDCSFFLFFLKECFQKIWQSHIIVLSLYCNQNTDMETIEEKTIGKYKIEIIPDECPPDPREDDNLGTMVCFHNRYTLGDKHDYDSDCYRSWDEMKEDIIKTEKVGVILPLYLYDHSGITMNTTGFSCPWDSGQVGWIYITKEKIHQEYGWKRITEKRAEKIREYLRNEVKGYDQYLTGDIYGYRITDIETEEEVDSCWGYYGVEYCMSEAESVVRHMMNTDKQGQLKLDLKE